MTDLTQPKISLKVMRNSDYSLVWNAFLAIEQKYSLYSLTIQDVRVWDYLRFFIFAEILDKSEAIGKPLFNKSTESLLCRLYRRTRLVKNFIVNNPLRCGKFEYLFINPSNARRKKNSAGEYYDIWCDPIISALGADRCVLLEDLSGSSCHIQKPIATPNVVYTESFNLYRRLHGFGKKPLGISAIDSALLKSIENSIFSEFSIRINLEEMFFQLVSHQQWLTVMFSLMLKQVQPKVVFLVCSYGKEGYILACREAGIPVIELQHGEMSKYHQAYSYPNSGEKKIFPDYFFSFGDYWTEDISLPIAADRCFSIGFPFLEKNISVYREIKKEKKILFLSVPYAGEEISKFASELMRILPEDWSITYKLHPSERQDWQLVYPHLIAEGITVVVRDEIPLYQLMAESSIQIASYTTAIYEGLAFKCKTYLIDLPGIENMHALLRKGYVKVITRPDEVRIEVVNDEDICCDDIFSPGWEANFASAMDRIL